MNIGHVLSLVLVDSSPSELDSDNSLAKLEFPDHIDGSLEG